MSSGSLHATASAKLTANSLQGGGSKRSPGRLAARMPLGRTVQSPGPQRTWLRSAPLVDLMTAVFNKRTRDKSNGLGAHLSWSGQSGM